MRPVDMGPVPRSADLLPATLRLGRIAGIPLGLHFSWLIIAVLITLSLAGHFRETHSAWSPATIWSVSALTALLFFATLLAHELSHALVARVHGLPVRSITLFALGGVAHIEKDSSSAKTEFLVAIVGPITSLAIGFGCLAVAQNLGWTFDGGGAGVAGSVLGWLGSINVILAVFNLIPGYPLDGGRVLRAVLWAIYKDVGRATRNAARAGQVVAGLFIAWGLLQFAFGGGLGGLWLAMLGWFLMIAAKASAADVSVADTLRDVRVADIMANDCATIDAHATVDELVHQILMRTGRRCVLVTTAGRVVGLVTPHEVRSVDRGRWATAAVRDVMRPLGSLRLVEPSTPAAEALKTMARDDVNQLPVVQDGRLEGVVTRSHILHLLQSRNELGRTAA